MADLYRSQDVTLRSDDGTIVAYLDAQGHLCVAGKVAAGVAPSSNPVYVSGIDGGGLKRGILTDTLGRIKTVGVITPDLTRLMIELAVDRTDVIAFGLMRQRGLRYTVPTGYNLEITGLSVAASDNKSEIIIGKTQSLGTYNSGTATFVAGTAYTTPVFGSNLYLEVTTAMGNTNDQIYTITYTNQSGTGSRTATVGGALKVKKLDAVGVIYPMALQTGDFGVMSVQSVAVDKANTGILNIGGLIQFSDYYVSVALATQQVLASSASWVVLEGETLSIDVGISKAGVGATAERQANCVCALLAK